MSFQLLGTNEVMGKLKSVISKMKDAGAEGVEAVASDLVSEAKDRVHVLSGETRDSIRILGTEKSEEGVRVVVGSDLDKAVFEEFGTINMEPIPFMRPGLEAVRSSALKKIAEPIEKELSG